MNDLERVVSYDLEIGLYQGKWKQAQQLARHVQDPLMFWMTVRRLFLELGGRYVGQKN